MTLRGRILLLIVLAVVPVFLVEAVSELQLRSSRQDELSQEALRLMRAVAAEQGRINEAARQLLVGFSEGKEVRSADWGACGETAQRVLARLQGYVNLGVATADGELLCSALPIPAEKDMRRQGFLKELSEAGQLLVGRYHVGLITGKSVLTMAVPLSSGAHAAPLLVWINLDLQWLARHYAETYDSRSLTLLITDRNGRILIRLPNNERWAGKPIGDQFMHLVNASAEGVGDMAGVDSEERFIAYSPVNVEPKGFYIGVGVTKAQFMRPINERTLWVAVISLAILVIATSAAWLMGAVSIRKPIEKLLRTAALWQRGDFSARVALPKTGSELSQLGVAFDEMAAAIEDREKNIGLLVRELEHRSGNLLGIVQAMAATTLRESTSEDARRGFIARLMALARSNQLFQASKGTAVDLLNVVKAELSAFHDRIAISGGSVLLPPAVAQKYTLALFELMTNAAKYGALSTRNGTIDVSWVIEGNAPRVLKLNWEERGGPSVRSPTREGFGTRLIKTSFPGAKLIYASEGFACYLESSLVD